MDPGTGRGRLCAKRHSASPSAHAVRPLGRAYRYTRCPRAGNPLAAAGHGTGTGKNLRPARRRQLRLRGRHHRSLARLTHRSRLDGKPGARHTAPMRHSRHPATHPRKWPWFLLAVLLTVVSLCALGGCSTIGYYSHLAWGEAHVLMARQSIEKMIADPGTPDKLRRRLKTALRARAFASDRLDLPRNDSYTLYADIDRPFVIDRKSVV